MQPLFVSAAADGGKGTTMKAGALTSSIAFPAMIGVLSMGVMGAKHFY